MTLVPGLTVGSLRVHERNQCSTPCGRVPHERQTCSSPAPLHSTTFQGPTQKPSHTFVHLRDISGVASTLRDTLTTTPGHAPPGLTADVLQRPEARDRVANRTWGLATASDARKVHYARERRQAFREGRREMAESYADGSEGLIQLCPNLSVRRCARGDHGRDLPTLFQLHYAGVFDRSASGYHTSTALNSCGRRKRVAWTAQ